MQPFLLQEVMRDLVRHSFLYRLYLMTYRFRFGLRYLLQPWKSLLHWVVHSRETSNFTYDLKESNLLHLKAFVTAVSGVAREDVERYVQEILNDQQLKAHVKAITDSGPFRHVADRETRFGRRVGWYALVRALKPKVVIETGVEKGLGACVLSAALLRNQAEGHPGTYYGTDINPDAGFLYRAPYSDVGRILVGDSIESLKKLPGPIDFFINDSDHSDEYEAREYETISAKLTENALLIADNAHVSDKLVEFATKTGREFLYFQEAPRDHWYPGAGIGAAWRKR